MKYLGLRFLGMFDNLISILLENIMLVSPKGVEWCVGQALQTTAHVHI